MRLTLDSPLFEGVLLVEFAGFIAAILWLAVAHARFVRRLRTQHPDIWREIQRRPTSWPADPVEKRSLRRRARVTDYLYRRRFRSLEDPVIQRLGEQACRASMLFTGYTVVGTALMLALVGFAK